jgi:hypothetical protein
MSDDAVGWIYLAVGLFVWFCGTVRAFVLYSRAKAESGTFDDPVTDDLFPALFFGFLFGFGWPIVLILGIPAILAMGIAKSYIYLAHRFTTRHELKRAEG